MNGENKMKICHFCGNVNFKKVYVEYTYKHNNKYLLVDDVPCEQCEFCGEQYFGAKVLTQIENEFQNIHSNRKQINKKITIPVENYLEFA